MNQKLQVKEVTLEQLAVPSFTTQDQAFGGQILTSVGLGPVERLQSGGMIVTLDLLEPDGLEHRQVVLDAVEPGNTIAFLCALPGHRATIPAGTHNFLLSGLSDKQ